MKVRHLLRTVSLLAAASVFLAGCAGTAPKPTYQQELAVESRIDAQDEAAVVVTAMPGVEILEMERTRIAQRLEERVATKKMLNASTDEPRKYRVELLLTRYERGSAFARAMMAGLGQIHLDGTVSVFTEPDNTRVTQFEIKKTFAWGGIYGGSTGMEEIERTFADGIAVALTGQEDDEAGK